MLEKFRCKNCGAQVLAFDSKHLGKDFLIAKGEEETIFAKRIRLAARVWAGDGDAMLLRPKRKGEGTAHFAKRSSG